MRNPEAAKKAVQLAREAAGRPLWVSRVLGVPLVLWRGVVELFKELGATLLDLLLALLALGLVLAVALLATWGWSASPVATVVLVAGAVAFLAYGGVEFFRNGRRGRLAAIAMGAFSFLLLWWIALMPLLPAVLFRL